MNWEFETLSSNTIFWYKIKQIYIWKPITTEFIILTLIYVISMGFLLLRRRRPSWRNVANGKEQGEMAVFAGYAPTGSPINRKNLCSDYTVLWSFMLFIVFWEQKLPEDISGLTYPSSTRKSRGGAAGLSRSRGLIGHFSFPYLKRFCGLSILLWKVKVNLLFSSRGISRSMV